MSVFVAKSIASSGLHGHHAKIPSFSIIAGATHGNNIFLIFRMSLISLRFSSRSALR